MGPKKNPPPPDAIVHRLDQGLTKADCEFVKDQFARYAVDYGLDLRSFRYGKKDNIDDFLGYLEEASPIWSGLDSIDVIWDETAIFHLRNTIKNQVRDNGAPLNAKMETYRKSKEQLPDQEPEPPQIDTSTKSKKATPAKVKQLGKRTREPSRDKSVFAAKATPANAQIAKAKDDQEEPKKARRPFNPTIFTSDEWAVVENELACQVLWKEIQHKKRELKGLHRSWQTCHAKSVYHVDPIPEFGDDQ